jgi:hypothetical protein
MASARYDLEILERWLGELQLLKHSLLPVEFLTFHISPDGTSAWEQALADTSNENLQNLVDSTGSSTLRFSVGSTESRQVWFDIDIGLNDVAEAEVLVKGNALRRSEQMRWQEIVRIKREEVQASNGEYVYHLACTAPSHTVLVDTHCSSYYLNTCYPYCTTRSPKYQKTTHPLLILFLHPGQSALTTRS